MKLLDNFLTSGHNFTENESLGKFRFAMLNAFLILPAISTVINYFASVFGVTSYGGLFELAIVIYFSVMLFLIFLLRKNKDNYSIVGPLFLGSSLFLFYFVLLTRPEDEFRLIGVFMGMFITFVLFGKIAGLLSAMLIVVSVFIISKLVDLELSTNAYNSFYTFIIVFAGLLYYFFEKVENDSKEFKALYSKLEDRVKEETSQRMEQEQMLLRRSRMANMGEMLDSIAHQWRQPLMHINSILLNMEAKLDFKTEKTKDVVYFQTRIDEVANLTTHMSQTIEDFRGLFKEQKEHTNFYLQDVIGDVLALLKNNLNDIGLEYNGEQDISVLTHRSELMQVIIIVLSNSIDVLNTRNIQNKKISIETGSDGNYAYICIEDNAGGISSENTDMIFDPYFTTKNQSGGTGLGLYIAKIIVEHNMEGTISVTNTEFGAKFMVSLVRKPSENPTVYA